MVRKKKVIVFKAEGGEGEGEGSMAIGIGILKRRYIDCCNDLNVVPNKAVLSALIKAGVNKSNNQESVLEILVDDLNALDFDPLYNVFQQIDVSDIDAVDVHNSSSSSSSSCCLEPRSLLSLLRALHHKLRTVDLRDTPLGRDFLLGLSLGGLPTRVLNLKKSHFRKINFIGNFTQLLILNLDFSSSLARFGKDCFIHFPILKSLSLRATKISNLWTTSSTLAKLPSLIQLRFQGCLCCDNTNACPLSDQHIHLYSNVEEDGNYYSFHDTGSESGDSTDTQVDFSNANQDFIYGSTTVSNALLDLPNQIFPWGSEESWATSSASSSSLSKPITRKNHLFYHPSPICYEKYYREFLISQFPNLKVLDNKPIKKADKDEAFIIYSDNFEYLPYKRSHKESVFSILKNREIKRNKSNYHYSRSLSASQVGRATFSSLRPLSITSNTLKNDGRKFRPRQFEYHPSNSNLMVIGTLDGEVVVVNHESEKVVRYISSHGAMNSVLGLCWLKKYPSKLISGSDNGLLNLYDIQHINPNGASVSFEEFDQLTSVHVNSVDELFLASGYSKHVALYDINTGKRLQVFTDMHQEHINVVKFANHSPSVFATSSFDRDVKMWDLRQKPLYPCYTASSGRGNVMVCFSPDDHHLLISAVDNEVKQLLAVDGRLHLEFGIAPTGGSQNYTRSYYMNGRDYILSGSCDEHVIRICCAQTGRRLRDISLEGKSSMFVQSLRGDPFRDFNLSVLAAYVSPSSGPEIVKVNMMTSRDADKESLNDEHSHSACGA